MFHGAIFRLRPSHSRRDGFIACYRPIPDAANCVGVRAVGIAARATKEIGCGDRGWAKALPGQKLLLPPHLNSVTVGRHCLPRIPINSDAMF